MSYKRGWGRATWRAALVLGAAVASTWACTSGDDAAAPVADGGVPPSDAQTGDESTPEVLGSLGAKCTSDANCESGLVCWREGVEERFPANGLCSKTCTDSTDCAAVKPGAICFKRGAGPLEGSWCGEPCVLGPGTLPSLRSGPNASKCHGRDDMACQAYGGPACGPSCNDDAQCGPGARCIGSTGLCSKTESTPWDQVGSAKPDGGSCGLGLYPVNVPNGVLCGAMCTLGVVPTCQWTGAGPATHACVFRPTTQGAGDRGFCGRLCDCTDDCPASLYCTAMPPSWAAETGRKGVCGGTGAEQPCAADSGTD
jgi:hypothetical protein